MRVSHEWGGGAAASRPRDRVEIRSPPRDALEMRAHRRLPTHAHMHARTPTHHTPHMHTCMRMPCSTAAARRCDFRGSYAGCFGWECARRAGSPRKGRGAATRPPPPPLSHEPHRPPALSLHNDWFHRFLFVMPRFDSTSIDLIVSFVFLFFNLFVCLFR